jgi:ribosomal protein S18 acetylase RimI-like enzyme
MDLTFKEITDINDDLLLPWLDLYETSFPSEEKLLISTFLVQLKLKVEGKADNWYMLAALDEQGEFAGLLCYEVRADTRVAVFWYLATRPELRGGGIGTACYNEVARRARECGAALMLLEVELPEESADPDLARRRIEFYRRQGARLLLGVRYMQSIGEHVPPIPMNMMIHPFEPVTPTQAFDAAKSYFEDDLQQVGELALE